jgi:hypothetical protein
MCARRASGSTPQPTAPAIDSSRPDARLLRGLEEGAALERGRPDGYADDGADRDAPGTASRLLQDRAQVQPGRLQVRDHTVVQRSDGDELGRRAAQQVGCVPPGGEDTFPAGTPTTQQHDGRFVQDDPAADVAHNGVGGAQVDTEFHS